MKTWLMTTLRMLFGNGVSQRPARWDQIVVPQMGRVYDSKYREDRIFFPLYIKSSFRRYGPDKPLQEWGANIGLEVKGKVIK